MIPLLATALVKSVQSGGTFSGVLCHDRAVYISRETWDVTWGCG